MIEMEYNSQRPPLVISEYGRNIQKMVDFACSIKDREERNKVANAIINVMGMLNPQLSNVEEFKPKLWAHLFIISDFKLDVDSPYPKPEREKLLEKPEQLKYPQSQIKYGHYGKTIPNLIEKCKELTDEKEKKELMVILANLMKRTYLTWNRDSVEDEVILAQLKTLSGGELVLEDTNVLASASDLVGAKKTNTNTRSGQSGKRNNNNKRNFRKRR